MGKELSNYMPNESVLNQAEVNPLKKVFEEANRRGEEFDPEKISERIARNFCEPNQELYRNNPRLKKDPIAAIESVQLVGVKEQDIKDPVEGLIVAGAKLETARNELGLSAKQKETFNGFLENIHGAAAFMRGKTARGIATGALIVSQALTAAGCRGIVPAYVEPEPSISPIVEVIDIPIETSTPEALPTQTEEYPNPDINSYPVSSEYFTKSPSISGEEAEKRIIELGAGDGLSQMKEWYRTSGISDSQMLPILYEGGSWNLAAKADSGNFLKFTITSGPEAGQVVRAMGMAAYLYNHPSFKTSELKTPDELTGSSQEMVWDESGWNVIGTFKDGAMTGWFNADQNVWVVENVAPAPTETVQAEEMRVLLSEKIEYEGLKYDFEITIPKNDDWVNSNFEKYGIESLKINEDKPNARELLTKVFAVEFLETYNFQNGVNIGLEEFINNPEKYPVDIVMRDADGQLTPQRLTLDQINSFELRLVSNKQGEAYMNMPRYTSLLSGYGFENGKFILYSNLTGMFSSLESTSLKFGKETEWYQYYPYLVSYKIAHTPLASTLGQMPYTVFKLVQHNRDESIKVENIFDTYSKTIDYDSQSKPGYISSNIEEDLKWRKQHAVFVVTIK